MNAARANALKRYDEIWRPYIFRDVIVGYRMSDGREFTTNLGECYSEFMTGPNLQELANYIEARTGAVAVWLISCKRVI